MPAGTYRSVVFWQGGPGQGYAYNVIHLKGDTGLATQENADQIGGLLDSALTESSWEQVYSSDIVCQHITLQELTDPPSAQFIGLVVHPGTATGDWLPAQVALVTSLHTAHGGRSGRGRIYGYGYTETALGDFGATDGIFNILQNDGWTAFNGLLLLAGDFQMAVYSRVDDESYPVVSFSTDTVFDTQRRRVR